MILTLLWSTSLLAGEGTPPIVRGDAATIEVRPRVPTLAIRGSPRAPASLLRPRGMGPSRTAALQPLARERPPRQTSQSKRQSAWRPALVASAVLAVSGAAVAYWSTDEADAAYDRYLRSAGSRRQQQALERAERYDRIAGAAFVAMEAGIVLTACLVFL